MDFPEGARYHVHIFEARYNSPPVEVRRLFRETLKVAFTGRMRKRRAGWWDFDAGGWWAKAHDRSFDCEANWPPLPEPARGLAHA